MSTTDKFALAGSEHQAFLHELGNLTLAWADVETVLYKLLKHYSGVTWPVARALFSGTRARAAMAFIGAIAENTGMEQTRKADLEQIFTQIASINSLRDFVVHNVEGSIFEFDDADPGKRYVTDKLRSSRESKSKSYLIGSSTLMAMTADCHECCWRLHPHWDPQNSPFDPTFGDHVRKTWKFKPPNTTKRRSNRS